jgi:hypothetical protein
MEEGRRDGSEESTDVEVVERLIKGGQVGVEMGAFMSW